MIDGLTIDDIGAIYRVHRATAARWLVGIRDKLVEQTRGRLAAKLGVDTEEAASIVRLVQSQLDVSVIRHLGPPPRR
jgi:RNA polymerase sigma-70 factor (ECF subfamily)